jgi:hypothetical protein
MISGRAARFGAFPAFRMPLVLRAPRDSPSRLGMPPGVGGSRCYRMSGIPPGRSAWSPKPISGTRSIRSTRLHFALTQKPAFFDGVRSEPRTIAPSPRAILQGLCSGGPPSGLTLERLRLTKETRESSFQVRRRGLWRCIVPRSFFNSPRSPLHWRLPTSPQSTEFYANFGVPA